jgi:hypothetical protein
MGGQTAVFFFVRVESVSGGASRQPLFSLSHCQSPEDQSDPGGESVSVGAPPAAVSRVLPGHDHRPWPAAEAGPRRMSLRANKRSAAPFSKGEPKPDPKPPGRNPGGAYGPRAYATGSPPRG